MLPETVNGEPVLQKDKPWLLRQTSDNWRLIVEEMLLIDFRSSIDAEENGLRMLLRMQGRSRKIWLNSNARLT